MKLYWVGALCTVLVRCPVHKRVRTPMYGLPLSQSDQRNRSVFQSVYNEIVYCLMCSFSDTYGNQVFGQNVMPSVVMVIKNAELHAQMKKLLQKWRNLCARTRNLQTESRVDFSLVEVQVMLYICSTELDSVLEVYRWKIFRAEPFLLKQQSVA